MFSIALAHSYLSEIYYRRGGGDVNRDLLDKAENEFLLAIGEDPYQVAPRQWLAYVSWKQGKCGEAVKEVKAVAQLAPGDEYVNNILEKCRAQK